MKRVLTAWLLAALLISTSGPRPVAPLAAAGRAAPQGRAAAVFPGAEWERIQKPESVGYCSDKLALVSARAKESSTTAMMAVVGGRTLFEYGDLSTVSYLASVRKSVLAMLYGNYVKSGAIKLNKTLAELKIDDIGGLLPIEKTATVADLLGARSGVYHEASNPGDNLADAPPRGSQKPGTYFLYSNWDFNALGTIFEQETGQSIYDALEKDLVSPVGMRDFDRATHRRTGDAGRSIHLAYHMNFSTRDMARLGYLMLRGGEWSGRQLVPRDWVKRISGIVTPVAQMNPAPLKNGPFGYGYLWWVWDGPWNTGAFEGGYTGQGAFGQYITLLPKLDMVIVHKTVPEGSRSVSWKSYEALLDGIVSARGCRD
jgi:CubicO group peptidase (beta-lactamase class C family)